MSILRDIMGVYGVNENAGPRSVRRQIDLIRDKRHIKISCVTVWGTWSLDPRHDDHFQRDIDAANELLMREADVWIYCTGIEVVTTDYWGTGAEAISCTDGHLFSLGRGSEARIAAYSVARIKSDSGDEIRMGCGPSMNPRGFLVRRDLVPTGGPYSGDFRHERVFAHELCHVVGDLSHSGRSGNLMNPGSRGSIPGATLSDQQVRLVLNDPDVEPPCGDQLSIGSF